jgi:hypothetical protein
MIAFITLTMITFTTSLTQPTRSPPCLCNLQHAHLRRILTRNLPRPINILTNCFHRLLKSFNILSPVQFTRLTFSTNAVQKTSLIQNNFLAFSPVNPLSKPTNVFTPNLSQNRGLQITLVSFETWVFPAFHI